MYKCILNVKIAKTLRGLYGKLGRILSTILHSERPKLYTILAFLSTIGLQNQVKLNMLKHTIKLLKLQQDSVPKKIYLLLKDGANKNMSYNGSQLRMEIPFGLTKQRIMDMYYQSWYSEINNSNRLITYFRYMYKHDFALKNI